MLKIINIEKDDKHTKVTVEVTERKYAKDPILKYKETEVLSFINANVSESLGQLVSSGPVANYREDLRVHEIIFSNPVPPKSKPKPPAKPKKPRTPRRKKKVNSLSKEES